MLLITTSGEPNHSRLYFSLGVTRNVVEDVSPVGFYHLVRIMPDSSCYHSDIPYTRLFSYILYVAVVLILDIDISGA
jgi:hypothetical protein